MDIKNFCKNNFLKYRKIKKILKYAKSGALLPFSISIVFGKGKLGEKDLNENFDAFDFDFYVESNRRIYNDKSELLFSQRVFDEEFVALKTTVGFDFDIEFFNKSFKIWFEEQFDKTFKGYDADIFFFGKFCEVSYSEIIENKNNIYNLMITKFN